MKTIGRKLKLGAFAMLVLSGLGTQCKDNAPSAGTPAPPPTTKANVAVYLTNPDKSALLTPQGSVYLAAQNSFPTIAVNSNLTFQTIDGFGFTLTGGSALHLNSMSASARAVLLNELFGQDETAIGISYLRISIGGSDLDATTFSYDDLPAGQTDVDMTNFSLAPDKQCLIPILKQILAINPKIKILGSPWSPPAWMKSNNNPKGGTLKTAYYDAYSKYFVKYVQAMASEGITIDAITIQNEPLYDGNNPSMKMLAEEQGAFVKNNLGPAFAAASIKTKIILYDHNADRTDYPISIMDDPDAKKYVDGSAFHLYGGSISSLSAVHTAHPDKNLYFTEQWTGAPGDMANDLKNGVRDLTIGGTRNWCKVVLQWNLSSNTLLEPHTAGGCTLCLGAITIDGDVVSHNPAYYVIGHASKFVRPGSIRIESTSTDNLPSTAFKTPDGKIVVIVVNNSGSTQSFNINSGKETFTANLMSGAVATYVCN